jgi:hypothetical protein
VDGIGNTKKLRKRGGRKNRQKRERGREKKRNLILIVPFGFPVVPDV